jgi:hypothetical protein
MIEAGSRTMCNLAQAPLLLADEHRQAVDNGPSKCARIQKLPA